MFPGEIFDSIIGWLDSTGTLKSCSLVCHAWLPRSRSLLFHTFTFPPAKSQILPSLEKPGADIDSLKDEIEEFLADMLRSCISPPLSLLVQNLTIDGRGRRVILEMINNGGFLLPFTNLRQLSIHHCDSEKYVDIPAHRCLQVSAFTTLLQRNSELESLVFSRVWFEEIEALLEIMEYALAGHQEMKSIVFSGVDLVSTAHSGGWQPHAALPRVRINDIGEDDPSLCLPELVFLGNSPSLPSEILHALASRISIIKRPLATVSVFDVITLDAYRGIFSSWTSTITCLKLDVQAGEFSFSTRLFMLIRNDLAVINDMCSPIKSFPELRKVTRLELYGHRRHGLQKFVATMLQFLPCFPGLSVLYLDSESYAPPYPMKRKPDPWMESDRDRGLQDLSLSELHSLFSALESGVDLQQLEEVIVDNKGPIPSRIVLKQS